jgi:hypothetical protein
MLRDSASFCRNPRANTNSKITVKPISACVASKCCRCERQIRQIERADENDATLTRQLLAYYAPADP